MVGKANKGINVEKNNNRFQKIKIYKREKKKKWKKKEKKKGTLHRTTKAKHRGRGLQQQ